MVSDTGLTAFNKILTQKLSPLTWRQFHDSEKVSAHVSLRGLRRLTWVDTFSLMHKASFFKEHMSLAILCHKGVLCLSVVHDNKASNALVIMGPKFFFLSFFFFFFVLPSSHSSVGGVQDLRTGGCPFRSPARPMFPVRHCDRIHSSLTAVHCVHNDHVGKQRVAWKEYYAECWLKKIQVSMDRCTGRCDITEILLTTALKSIQSINFAEKKKKTGPPLTEFFFITRTSQGSVFLGCRCWIVKKYVKREHNVIFP